MPESKNVSYTRDERLIFTGLQARDREIAQLQMPLRADYQYWIDGIATRLGLPVEEFLKQYQITETELVYIESVPEANAPEEVNAEPEVAPPVEPAKPNARRGLKVVK